MICYFWKDLQSLMRVEIKQQDQELNNFKDLVKKAVGAQVKVAIRFRSYACKINQYCVQDSWPTTTKTNTKSQTMKDLKTKKLKS